MNKEYYERTEMEILTFMSEDVIMTTLEEDELPPSSSSIG